MTVITRTFRIISTTPSKYYLEHEGAINAMLTVPRADITADAIGLRTGDIIDLQWDDEPAGALVFDSITLAEPALQGLRSLEKSVDYAMAEADEVVLVDAAGGEVEITLPPHTEGTRIYAKKIDSSPNKVRIITPGAELIDGEVDAEISVAGTSLTLFACSDCWRIV